MNDDQGAPPPSEPEGRRLDRLNRWLTLAANLGVLLGLIVLIVEVRQSAALARTELEINANNALSLTEYNLATPHNSAAWVKSVRAPWDMTDEEIRLVEAHLVAVMQQWDTLFDMEAIGLVSRARVRSHISNTAPYYFGSAHAKHWWHLQEPGWENTSMYVVAGPIINDLDENFLANYLDASRLPAPAPAGPEEGEGQE